MLNLFLTILRRDLTLSLRRKSDLAQVIFFFAVVVTLVPLGVGAETNILRAIAPGVVWVAALLAALLSLPRMFATASRHRDCQGGGALARHRRSDDDLRHDFRRDVRS